MRTTKQTQKDRALGRLKHKKLPLSGKLVNMNGHRRVLGHLECAECQGMVSCAWLLSRCDTMPLRTLHPGCKTLRQNGSTASHGTAPGQIII